MTRKQEIENKQFWEVRIYPIPPGKGRVWTRKMMRHRAGVIGKTSGLSYREYWAWLFQINEYLPQDRKLTDWQLARAVLAEFWHYQPAQKLIKRDNLSLSEKKAWSVARYRLEFNMRKLLKTRNPKRAIPPDKLPVSFRYNKDGVPCNRHENPLTQEQIDKLLAQFPHDQEQPILRSRVKNIEVVASAAMAFTAKQEEKRKKTRRASCNLNKA